MNPCTVRLPETIDNHRLHPVRWVCSPNYDARPQAEAISLIVVHNISLPPGKFGGEAILQLFTNTLDWQADPFYQTIEGLRVSSHVLIRRNGEVIQLVDFHQRAWHAGVSCFKGKEKCNDFAIGIELEGTDDTPYEESQYQALATVCALLQAHYPITDIVGHSDIAPNRKTDPGAAFNWKYFHNLLCTS